MPTALFIENPKKKIYSYSLNFNPIDELFGERSANGNVVGGNVVTGAVVTGTEELKRDWDSNHDGKIDIADASNIYSHL